ncbi:MAG: dihydroorotase [Muribaculaceae bacterium]|nr:dihydroorotase [Muribaculaceae bacterium]
MELIYNATLINEGTASTGFLAIEDGLIAEVGHGEPSTELMTQAAVKTNAHGDLLMPGVIDDHVHFREPGLTHKADIATESRAAVTGGVTSFMDMPNVKPPTTSLETLDDKFERAAQKSVANYSFYIGATASNIDLLRNVDYSRVCGVKVFLGSSTGGMLLDDDNALRRLFSTVPALIAAHCEDESIINENRLQYQAAHGPYIPAKDHPMVRSREACLQSTHRAISLAKETGARLHVLHISTADELELLEQHTHLTDKRITAEACLGHLWFCDDDYTRLDNRIRVNPAIKTLADRTALRRAVAEGLIDVVATDHAPHLLSDKSKKNITVASGMPLAQFSLVAMLELAYLNEFSVTQVTQAMSHAPAILFGIDRRGFLRKGYHADLVQVRPDDAGYIITDDSVVSKCGWTPLAGAVMHHRVVGTWVNGHKVLDHGAINDIYLGQPLTFKR